MSDPNAIFRRALELADAGAFADAVGLFRQLLTQLPGHPQIIAALANAELEQGHLDAAISLFRQSLRIVATQPDIWCSLSRALRRKGRTGEAVEAADRALGLVPDLVPAWMARGNAQWDLGRFEEALGSYRRAAALQPDDPRPHFNCANALHKLQRLPEAVDAFGRALALEPRYGEAHLNLANVLADLGRMSEALASVERAIALQPDNPQAQVNRGVFLTDLGRLDEALEAFARALTLEPGFAEAYSSRGVTLRALGRAAEALADFEQALQLQPEHVNAAVNRAAALLDVGRLDDALEAAGHAFAKAPDHRDAPLNLAIQQLLHGDFENGWRLYEERWRSKGHGTVYLQSAAPQWRGEDIAGKTILVWPEQGFGDFIQFCRYIPFLAAKGARVILETRPRLKPLVASLQGVSEVIEQGAKRPAFDVHCPIMSLPRAFNTTLQTVPANVPYLSAAPGKVEAFLQRMPSVPRIGLAWEGGMSSHPSARQRNLPLAALEPLLQQSLLQQSYVFHALQKEFTDLPPPVVQRHDAEQKDFADAAALIAAMDLVITVDTVVAHIAGALGKPVWLLLPYVADWRWLIGREDSPWYPTMRLFRQSASGDWAGVVARVSTALEALHPA